MRTVDIILVILVLFLLNFMSCSKEQITPCQIPNASFEQTEKNKPAAWQTHTWRGTANFDYSTTGRNGNRCVGISSNDGADVSWSAIVPVKPFSKYKFSGWIKTENLLPASGKGALFNLHGVRGAETKVVTGTHNWTKVEMKFATGRNDAVQINCLFGGWGLCTGKAWYDDLNLQLISTKELNPMVTIDPNRTSEPISRYIYGQFIEHLGRCIYGGIWAEMLEDRKFYYPITDHFAPWGDDVEAYGTPGIFKPVSASPWQVIGPPGSVTMDSIRSFVGTHSPVIHILSDEAKAGIKQAGLALIKDKKYDGRIILAGEAQSNGQIRMVINKQTILTIPLRELNDSFKIFTFSLTANESCENASLKIVGSGKGSIRIGAVSLMPSDNIKGWRADVIALLRELNAPVYRWPGGNFVSGYNWRDGIGDRDKRPPRKNPAWTGVEHNDVGIHEYMDLMTLIGAEPFIAVNTGLGTVEEIAKEVEYCNSSVDKPMGKLRAQNGHPQPFGVKWWAVGNEMYGDWQLGHIPLEDYVKKHNQVARAMRQIDSTIKLVAVGSVGRWSETMLKSCSDFMDLISEHIYTQEKPGLLEHTAQLAQQIKWKADAHRKYREDIPGLADKDIRIAMDEWNYWYGPHVYGELGVRYFLKDALGVAIGLHEYFRNSDLYFMANYAQTVNVIGCIKTTKTAAAFATTGLVLQLYHQQFGTIPAQISGAPEPLDVFAALTEDKEHLTIGIVNPTRETIDLPIELKNYNVKKDGKHWFITGEDPMLFNEPGQAPRVKIEQKDIYFSTNLVVLPISVNIYKFEMNQQSSDSPLLR